MSLLPFISTERLYVFVHRVEKKERARLKTVKFHARTGMIESNRVSDTCWGLVGAAPLPPSVGISDFSQCPGGSYYTASHFSQKRTHVNANTHTVCLIISCGVRSVMLNNDPEGLCDTSWPAGPRLRITGCRCLQFIQTWRFCHHLLSLA